METARHPGDAASRPLLLLVLGAALLLRVAGLDWGFPLLCHPDEFAIADHAYHLVETRSLDPGRYYRPNLVSIYLGAASFAALSPLVFGRPLTDTFPVHPEFFYLVSRSISALFGALSVYAAWRVAREYRRDAALPAAFLFALLPSYVEHAHYATPDVSLTFFALMTVLFTVRYLRRPRYRELLLTALFCALATMEKYPGLLTAVWAGAAVAARHVREPRTGAKRLAAMGVVFAVLFVLLAPGLVLNAQRVMDTLRSESRAEHLGADQLGWAGNALFYARSYVGLTGLLMLVPLAAGAAALVRRERLLALPLFFGVFYWLVLSRVPLHWERWAPPMYTSGLLLSAIGACELLDRARGWGAGPRRVALAAWTAAAVVALAHLALAAAVKTLSACLKDPRVAALEYLDAHGMTPDVTASEKYTPYKLRDLKARFRGFGDYDPKRRYVVTSSYMYRRFLGDAGEYSKKAALYRAIFAYPLLAEFAPAPAIHRMDFLDVDDVTLQTARGFELGRIADSLRFLRLYFARRDELLAGPTIRIHRLLKPI
jgi:4-amino-4-deoxy-L-arabinose transferase-like glycosyltransferase